MTGPAPDLDASIIPEGLPADLLSLWSTAVATLTERELSALVMRFGFSTGKPESFSAIGRELGVNRVRAHAIFRNAIQRLGAQDETRALARYLADLNAVLSDEGSSEPAEREPSEAPSSDEPVAVRHLRRRVSVIEESRDQTSNGGSDEDAPEFDRGAPVSDEARPNAADPNDDADRTVDQAEPADEDEVVADEPVSERDALKLVQAADRELARAIEECVGREDLLAELQRARTRIAAGMREIESQAPVSSAPASSGKRRGRPENVEEAKRRSALLKRVQAGDLTNSEAATEIGITYAAWSAWKSIHQKRNGVIAPAPSVRAVAAPSQFPTGKRGRGRPSDPVETDRRSAVLERVCLGELSNTQAAKELGITHAAWSAWKVNYGKRVGEIVPAPKTVETRTKGIEPASTVRPTPPPDVSEFVARIERIERFGAELRRRVRELVAFVEERGPG